MLKKFIIAGTYVAPAPPTLPRDYYISANGTGDGLTSGTPAPLSVLQAATLITDDNIFLNKGDEFL